MDLSMEYFLAQVTSNPLLLIAVLLTLGVILVNGWTDAPNAIATCVVTRCMPVRAAILMAAVFNFLGVFLMSILNATVAETITKMVDFGTNSHEAIVALSAALFAIVVWAVLAWYFGIPTSESHALIAGLTGGAIALHGGLEGVNGSEWIKVIYGLVISVVMGFAGLFHLQMRGSDFPERGTPEDGRLFPGSSDLWRRLYELHARSAGWTEIHGRYPAVPASCKRKQPGYRNRRADAHLADAALLCRHGSGNIHRRQKNHQIRRHGYGKTGEIPGLFR